MDQKQTFPQIPVTQGEYKPRTRLVVVFIAGCAVGALVVLAWNNNQAIPVGVHGTSEPGAHTGSNGKGATGNTVPTNSALRGGIFAGGEAAGAVSIINQPAGNSVLVQSVTVPPPGVWIAVRETKGKALGNILGASRVHGPRSNVTVYLLRNTEPNRTYAIELYRSHGKGSGFDYKADSVYVDFDTGRPVIALFRTTSQNNASASTSPATH